MPPEVKKAIFEGEGYSIRESETVGEKMVYYARKIEGNRVIRVAYPLTYVDSLTRGFLRQNITIFFLLFLMIGLISAYLASRISIPVNRLDEITNRIDKGKHHVHFPHFRDPTMARISGLIYRIYSLMRGEQKRLLEEQEKLNLIISVLDEAILFLDKNDRILLWNGKVEEYLYLPMESGENIYQLVDSPQTLNFLNRVISSEGRLGENIPFRGRVFEAYTKSLSGGKLIVFYDVTEKARYESFKTELVGNISHELKTPLSMIMGYAETLMNDPHMEKEVMDRFLETIFTSSRRLNDLINDVLELHRLESIDHDFSIPEPTEVSEVNQAVSGLFEKVDGKTISLVEEVGRVFVHFEHITSVLTNLIDNAVKYSTGGNIDASIKGVKGGIKIEVADEGPQVPEEELMRIFERFYTVSKSRARGKSGTGLGLSIVKHISQIYNGSVTLTRNSNGGNTFTVILHERPTA